MRMRSSSRLNKKGAKKDSAFLTVTLVQSILCIAMLLLAFAMSNVFGMTELKPAFSSLITSQTEAIEVFKLRSEEDASSSEDLSEDGAGGAINSTVPANIFPNAVTMSQSAIYPINGRITSLFGRREHPVTKNEDFHTGLDIAAPTGTTIKAIYPGVVTEVGVSKIYGNYIIVDHGSVSSKYSHCDTIVAEVGMRLRQGETVATVGATGLVTGSHLHLELYVGDKLTDPLFAL